MTRGEAIANGGTNSGASNPNGPGTKPREVAESEVTHWTLSGAW